MHRESTFLKRLADLSPAKQALLEKRLRDERQQEGDRTTDIPRRAREEQRPFHLGQEVPWRRLLLRLDEEEHIALTVMHHIITDAWSMEVFVGELTTLYEAFSAGKASPLPQTPLQYADYACWQRQR